jgi:hypothetical protein
MAAEYGGKNFRQTSAPGLAKITGSRKLALNGLGKKQNSKISFGGKLREFGESLRKFRGHQAVEDDTGLQRSLMALMTSWG